MDHLHESLTTFYIVRHGETDWNVQQKVQGHTDIPLNENGEIQAKDFAEKLRHITFDIAFSSDLLRAKRTAEIIALEHELDVETTELLREKKLGKLEGEHWETFSKYFALLNEMDHQERLQHKFVDDAESDEEVTNRLLHFLEETAIANPGKKVLVVTHGGLLRAILLHLKYATYDKLRHSKISNTAHIELVSDGEKLVIKDTDGITFMQEDAKPIE